MKHQEIVKGTTYICKRWCARSIFISYNWSK